MMVLRSAMVVHGHAEGKTQRAKETAPGFIKSQALRRSISYLC